MGHPAADESEHIMIRIFMQLCRHGAATAIATTAAVITRVSTVSRNFSFIFLLPQRKSGTMATVQTVSFVDISAFSGGQQDFIIIMNESYGIQGIFVVAIVDVIVVAFSAIRVYVN